MRLPVQLLASFALAATAGAAERVDYLKDVKPVLVARCYACHGALKQKAELRLDTAEFIRKGGKHGPAIVAGKPEKSRLIERITAKQEDERMPPEGEALKPEQIAAITAWVKQGASAPPSEQPERDPRDHWAFKAPQKAALPKAQSSKIKAQNPVDAFLEAQRRKQGLSAAPAAEKSIWLRRVALDLTGLAPTLAEIREFEADTSPTAHEKAVERLLASPHYGERWGRHFMDIWRYSDWWGLGAQLRYSQKHIWHWRDWIVESLNADKGYDRMIVEQLAGDELAPTDADTLRATGFLARNYYLFNRTTWMDEVVEHTSKAFLGLTMNCAKCHDHKYDPLTHTDYYAMRAVFEPYHARLDELPGETDLEKDGLPRAFDLHLDRATYIHLKGDEKNPDTNRVISPAVPAVLAFRKFEPQPVALPLASHTPALRTFVLENHLRAAEKQIADARPEVEKAKQKLAELAKLPAPATPDRTAPNATEPKPAPASTPAKSANAVAAGLRFSDNFAAAKPDLWQLGDGEFTYADGVLRQSRVAAERSYARSRADHPAEFEARAKFRITGGDLYRSVGFTFDTSDARETLVYLSAHAPGPKLQVALGNGRAYTYPPAGMQSRMVKLGETYELTVRVRGTLLNVAVNGEHALAFELPSRAPGKFQLITYDATADFVGFELGPLPAEAQLAQSSAPALTAKSAPAPPPSTLEQARAALKAAELALAAAQTRPAALRSAWDADSARSEMPGASKLATLITTAAQAEAKFKLAQAEADVAKAEADLGGPAASAKKKDDPGQKLKTAQDSLEKARKAAAAPGTNYTSVRATLKAQEGPDETEAHRALPYPTTSTGRRTAFAQWIADRQNPLTARVLVNHIWARHFGQPLVANLTDFGRRSPAPPHQELLDWLAVDFMEHGWSLKHLHRTLVLSEAYQMSSSTEADEGNKGRTKPSLTSLPSVQKNLQSDPENRFLWRMNAQRMDSHALRDSLLHLAGLLDPKLGGPTISPKVEDTAFRRSLYFTQSPEDLNKFLEMFDNANTKECYRRAESILPQQALALANSKLTATAAAQLAERIAQDTASASDEDFVRAAFETILATKPSAAEQQACAESLAKFRAALTDRKHPQADAKARTDFVQALLNHNDFIVIR